MILKRNNKFLQMSFFSLSWIVGLSNSFTNTDYATVKVSRETFQDGMIPQGNEGFQTNSKYLEGILFLSLVGGGLATFFCIFGILTCCFASCKKRKDSNERVSRLGKQIMATIFILGSSVIIAGVIIGFISNRILSNSTNEFINSIEHTVNYVKVREVEIVNNLELLDPNIQLTGLQTEVDKVASLTKQSQNAIYEIDTVRIVLIFIAFYVSLATATVGITTVIFLKSTISSFFYVMGFLTLFVIWWSYAIYMPFLVLVDDMCISVNNYLDNNTNNQGPLDYFLTCLDSENYSQSIDEALNQAQDEFSNINNMTIILFNYTFDPSISTNGSLEERLNETIEKAQQIIFQVQKRASNLTDVAYGTLNASLQRLELLIQASQDLLDLLNCDYYEEFISNLKNLLCINIRNAIILEIVATYFIGITALPLTVVAIFGSRRLELLNIYIKNRIILQALCLVEISLGIVSIGLFGLLNKIALIFGSINIVFPILAFVGSIYMKKWTIILYTVSQSLQSLVALILIVIFGIYSSDCELPVCSVSIRIDYVISLIVASFLLVPVVLGTIIGWKVLSTFTDVKGVTEKVIFPKL